MMLFPRLLLPAALLAVTLGACNSNDNERFNEQKESYVFESTTSTLTAFGASKLEEDGSVFRCPAISGMSNESGLTVFKTRANAPFPHFTLSSIANIRSDRPGGFGISIADLPVGMLDIYQKCNSTSYEQLTTSCPSDYEIVQQCSGESGAKECALLYEGSHQLVVSARILDDKACFSEESNRAPYGVVPDIAKACDAFSPISVAAAYRGNQPSNNCCDVNNVATLDFCLKPCGCRELSVQIVPKKQYLDPLDDAVPVDKKIKNQLKIAVFSNVEGKSAMFENLLQSINEKNVDVAVSLGNLTSEGRASQFENMRALVDNAFSVYDGAEGGKCLAEDKQICCTGEERKFPNRCNAVLTKTAFIAGIGEDEMNSSDLDAFRELFGPSNSSTTFGKVQLIMLDTADSSLISAERSWLEGVLGNIDENECNIPKPTDFDEWPTLNECREILGLDDSSAKTATCRECIKKEAWCIPPDVSRSDYQLGPENCVCIPNSATYCKNNLTCEAIDGSKHRCICSRDEDCGSGASCVEGVCKPPLRLVFSYTPIFDEYGSRNESFASKSEAASLLSLLIESGVSAIFAGRVLDYSHYSKGGIDMYITGGGGADMASFSKVGHHWLLVTVPDAYTNPNPDDITVEVVEF